MKVLMFGWEFPPHNSGGLGVACQGLANALSQSGVQLTFVLPKKIPVHAQGFNLIFADETSVSESNYSMLNPYVSFQEYRRLKAAHPEAAYGLTLLEEVRNYAYLGREIARQQEFDVIHAHDWLSVEAGLQAKQVSGKPLVFHVHATEFDRTGGTHVNQQVYEIERQGIQKSDQVVAVSNFTKDIITRYYGVSPDKVQVVHNGINAQAYEPTGLDKSLEGLKKAGKKIVLFVGRITLQKGPDYFLRAAQRVSAYMPNAIFVMAGSGDMERSIIQQAASYGISDRMIFAGFLRGEELNSVYQAADVMVMPSVSEPFGITALESLANATPVIISKQSGASEVLSHVLKVDFWDIDEMTNKIMSVLAHPSLQTTLQANGKQDVRRFTWEDAARKCQTLYQSLAMMNAPSVA